MLKKKKKLKIKEVVTSLEVEGKITKRETTKLEDEINELEEAIREKKLIRQKVLKHIFHNYDEITKIQGGNVFLDNVVESWEINKKFIGKEIAKMTDTRI